MKIPMITLPNLHCARSLATGIMICIGSLVSVSLPAAAEEPTTDEAGFLKKMDQWQEKMSDAFRDTWMSVRRNAEGTGSTASIDLREQNQAYVVRLSLPDRDLSKVEIKLEDNTLRILIPEDGKSARYEQSVVLDGIASGTTPDIDRKQEDGLIVITVPKNPSVHERKPSAVEPDVKLTPQTDQERGLLDRMERMRLEMDRIFNEAFEEFRVSPLHRTYFDEARFGSFVDLKEEGGNYVVNAYLPRREMKNVNVTVEGQTLRIEAKEETTADRSEDGKESVTSHKAKFVQIVTLPEPVRADEMKVERKDEMLTVTIPKTS